MIKPLEMAEIVLPRRTLFKLNDAAAILGLSGSEATALVEDGTLRLAFNLAVQANDSARFILVTAESISDYDRAPKLRRAETPASARAEITALFSPLEDRITATRLREIFRCSSQHLARLVKAHHIEVARPGRRGGGNAALITRASCIEFLLQRRITG